MSTWEVSQIPVIEDGEVVGGLVERHPDDARPRAAVAARPSGARGDGRRRSRWWTHTFPTDRLAPMLTRDSPAALVRKDGRLVGIVSRYDVLQQLIGTR